MSLRHHKYSGTEHGFTLIEAIVAMAIIGITAFPIMLLISQSLDQLTRAADANARATAISSALSVMDPVNPTENPSGEIDMGSVSFTWDSDVIVPENDGIQIGTGLVGYFVSFYNVQIDFIKDEEPWFSFSTRKVGYRRIVTGNPFETVGQ
ncbi:MAG: prepilin-type N-terminal cleavage/methylation domain-containing protein [Alphaproteobacteria bacterium]|nr:prepilin-type N-terminal cleavage/methylation domain-containing protein [Alphaproteobacteria bacterium]